MSLSSEDYQRAARVIAGCSRVLVTSHIRPDGDAIGALVAMRSVLQRLGKEPIAVTLDPVPPKYELLVQTEPLDLWQRGQRAIAGNAPEAVVVIDTCTRNQIEPIAPYLESLRCPKIVLDHHTTREDMGDVYLIDKSASASCVLLLEWADAVGWPIDDTAAEALFVGISTDTGWFRFVNTDARTLRSAARLIEFGLQPGAIYERLFLRDSPGRLRLLGALLGTLELHADGRVAVVCLTQEMFRQCGARPGETEDLINEPQRIASVLATILLVEQDDDRVRISMRSKSTINVAEIAEQFGGGGHERAAGAWLPGRLEDVKDPVIQAVCSRLG